MTKAELKKYFDQIAPQRDAWKRRNAYYYQELESLCRLFIPPGRSVLELGCGTGDLLAALRPSRGLGIDLSDEMVRIARGKYPELEFRTGDVEAVTVEETFDYVLLSDLVGSLDDIWKAFRELQRVVRPETRIVVTYYNYLWEPALKLAERLGLKMGQQVLNWLPLDDLENLFYLNGFETIKKGYRFLIPKRIPVLAPLVNNYLARLPGIRKLCLVEYLVVRPTPAALAPGAAPGAAMAPAPKDYSVSVIVPCRDEVGNIEGLVERLPAMGCHTELIFVDGDSRDGTPEVILRLMEKYRGRRDITLLHQRPPRGKGDAVRLGFEAASGDILMILDADLSVDPEDLPKFYLALVEGKGELINGSRMVYQMEKQAMRFLNLVGNKSFSLAFTWLLEQRIRDTLCGTKALFRRDYDQIKANRAHFGDFDPFGDFDLLFGAARLNLRIVEVPVRYRERTYGTTKIHRWRHGWLLFRMCGIAVRKLKFA
jgi:SAM-dependent methyltransferase